MDAKASQLTPLNDIWPSRGETNNRYASSFKQRQRKPSLVYDEEIMPPGKAITTHNKQHKHKTRTCYRKVTHNCILCNQKTEHCRSQEISSAKTSEIQNFASKTLPEHACLDVLLHGYIMKCARTKGHKVAAQRRLTPSSFHKNRTKLLNAFGLQ